jgi:hypothetical protein
LRKFSFLDLMGMDRYDHEQGLEKEIAYMPSKGKQAKEPRFDRHFSGGMGVGQG